MRIITDWDDLKQFGIQMLTGEACGCGMRVLCDLNDDGVAIMNEFWGGNVIFAKDSNWNREVNGKEAVASVLLPYSILKELAAFCLLATGSKHTWIGLKDADGTLMTNDVIGLNEGESMPEDLVDCSPVVRTYTKFGTAGLRNIHQMTGRKT